MRPALPPAKASCAPLRGVTLVEMLIAVAVLAALIGLLLPVVGMLRESARRSQALRTVTALHMAARLYADEDAQRRFPAGDADRLLHRASPGTAPRTLDALLRVASDAGLRPFVDDPATAGAKLLLDPWARPYRYAVDDDMDGAVERPGARTTWNHRDLEPFAYVWSLGRPRAGAAGVRADDPDGNAAGDARWIVVEGTR